MSLLTPPADRSEAPLAVAVKVWTRERAASKRWQAAGFLSVATTRNWMVASCATAWAENIPASEAATTQPLLARSGPDEELSRECASETVTGILPETRRPRYYRSLSEAADIHICIAAIAHRTYRAAFRDVSAMAT